MSTKTWTWHTAANGIAIHVSHAPTRPTVTQIALAANLATRDAQILPLAANQMRRVFTAGTRSASTRETAPV